jgi:CheY-like chemotaxis protein
MNSKSTPHTICLIDDDAIYQFTAKKIIELVDPQRKVLSFTNGKQALDYFTSGSLAKEDLPDVIFLDINMPVMDGWEFLEGYQAVNCLFDKSIPVYMVSSSVDEQDVLRSKTFDIVKDFIVKPMNKTRIAEILQAPVGLS